MKQTYQVWATVDDAERNLCQFNVPHGQNVMDWFDGVAAEFAEYQPRLVLLPHEVSGLPDGPPDNSEIAAEIARTPE